MKIYNLFPLLAGPFSRWTEHFTRAAAMGFDWAFVNPIQQPGASRSLYSIADYFPNPTPYGPFIALPNRARSGGEAATTGGWTVH